VTFYLPKQSPRVNRENISCWKSRESPVSVTVRTESSLLSSSVLRPRPISIDGHVISSSSSSKFLYYVRQWPWPASLRSIGNLHWKISPVPTKVARSGKSGLYDDEERHALTNSRKCPDRRRGNLSAYRVRKITCA